MLHIICTNDLPFSFSYFRRLFFLSWFHYFCLIFRARILFPYLYLNFHSCTRSIVCRFWLFFRCEFLLFAESSLFFSFFSVHVIFICIQKNFNDIFFLVLLFCDSIFSVRFLFFSSITRYFCRSSFLSFCQPLLYSPWIRKNRAKITYYRVFHSQCLNLCTERPFLYSNYFTLCIVISCRTQSKMSFCLQISVEVSV